MADEKYYRLDITSGYCGHVVFMKIMDGKPCKAISMSDWSDRLSEITQEEFERNKERIEKDRNPRAGK